MSNPIRRQLRHGGVLLAIAAVSLGNQCPSLPELQDRVVELVATGSVEVEFCSEGEINDHNDTQTINLNDEVDFLQVIEDAGLDIDDVKEVELSGVSYKRTVPDPTADRQIVNGMCTLQRGSGPEVVLFSGVSEFVNSVTEFKTAPISAAGVNLLQQMLDDILLALRAGEQPTDMEVTYTVSGQSVPGEIETNFKWAVKLDISIVGEFDSEVIG